MKIFLQLLILTTLTSFTFCHKKHHLSKSHGILDNIKDLFSGKDSKEDLYGDDEDKRIG